MIRLFRVQHKQAAELDPGEQKFYLKPGTVDMIQTCWQFKSRRELAKFLNISHSLLSCLDHQEKHVSDDFMIILARLFTLERFWVVLEVRSTGKTKRPNNHPSNNYKKHNGELPYGRYSPAAAFRKLDYPVETEGD